MQVLLQKEKPETHHTLLEGSDTLYVHLCSGNVIEVQPATAVRVTDDEVIVLDGEDVVATFRRNDVYFAADVPMEPPSLK